MSINISEIVLVKQKEKQTKRETKQKVYPREKYCIRKIWLYLYINIGYWYTVYPAVLIVQQNKTKQDKTKKKMVFFFKSIFFLKRTPRENIAQQHRHAHNIHVVHMILENVHMDIVQQ